MKAVALFSGGLDSSLAVKVIANQGIEVIALHFWIPFSRGDKEAVSQRLAQRAQQLGAKLNFICLGEDFLEILRNPQYGYGKNYNPCIDCKILMLKHAKQLMKNLGASFAITGAKSTRLYLLSTEFVTIISLAP